MKKYNYYSDYRGRRWFIDKLSGTYFGRFVWVSLNFGIVDDIIAGRFRNGWKNKKHAIAYMRSKSSVVKYDITRNDY